MTNKKLTKFTYEYLVNVNILHIYFYVERLNKLKDNDYYKIQSDLSITLASNDVLSGGVVQTQKLKMALELSCNNAHGSKYNAHLVTDANGMVTFYRPAYDLIMPYAKTAYAYFEAYEKLFIVLYAEEKYESGDITHFHILFDRFYKDIQRIMINKEVKNIDINALIKQGIKDD